MLRTALRNLLAHKLRLALSGLAVVLGVAFISGTMIFTDTLERTFTDLFETTSADVNIEPRAAFETGLTGTGGISTGSSVPESVVDTVLDVDGVAAAEGYVQVEGVYVLDKEGKVLNTGGAPGIGASWSEDEELSGGTLTEGRAPTASGEVVLDTGTAEKTGYEVGDTLTVLTTGPRIEAELVGVVRYGENGGTAGASLTVFEADAAQELFLEPGAYTGVGVRAETGESLDAVRDRIAEAIGRGYDVKTATEQAGDLATSLEEELGFINTFLLVFAGVALFVGSFIILNTFSMLVAQRTRELALMRALGASRRQVTASVLLEALLLGLLGSTTGLLVGYGLAHALKALFGRIGLTLDAPLTFSVSTVAWAYAVGVLITMLAAYLPGRRAARVPPVAAMRADLVAHPRSLSRRTAFGTPLAVAGAAVLVVGPARFDGGTAGYLAGAGALALIVGAIALSPVLALPFIRVVGLVLPRLAGTTGHLARENALRNPRRTAATSSALMIGLALVTGFSILGASTSASVDALIDDTLKADFVVSSALGQPFTPTVADEIRDVEGVGSVSQERWGMARIAGEDTFFVAHDPASLTEALEVRFVSGDLEGMRGGGVLVSELAAEDHGWSLGDSVRFLLPNGQRRDLSIGGIFERNDAFGSYVVSLDTYAATGGMQLDRYAYVHVAAGADPAAVRTAVEAITAEYPIVNLKDTEEFKEERRAQVDQLLMLINALLVLSVLIAVLGVVNTLVLSVIERTRELGLLRAIGMTRRQTRRLVRLESVVISLYGAALGLALGTFFGVSLTRSLEEQGITDTVVPFAELLLFLVLGAVIGVVAAAFPARRAGRLKVLEAIATE